MEDLRRWWGEFRFEVGDTKRWHIGPLSLSVHRGAFEWQVTHDQSDDPFRDDLEIAVDEDPQDSNQESELKRYAFLKTPEMLRLVPALADRPMVVSPVKPVLLLPDEEAVLYVSSPLWLRLEVGKPWRRVQEVATFRPSDSWFGPSTILGELCYAIKTSARLKLEDLPIRPHRAVSAVTIRNEADSALPLERLKLPTPNLSLYSSSDGRLWTDGVVLEREEDHEQATVRLTEENIPHGAELVSEPRKSAEKRFLLDAFTGLLSRRGEKKDDRVPAKPGPGPDIDP